LLPRWGIVCERLGSVQGKRMEVMQTTARVGCERSMDYAGRESLVLRCGLYEVLVGTCISPACAILGAPSLAGHTHTFHHRTPSKHQDDLQSLQEVAHGSFPQNCVASAREIEICCVVLWPSNVAPTSPQHQHDATPTTTFVSPGTRPDQTRRPRLRQRRPSGSVAAPNFISRSPLDFQLVPSMLRPSSSPTRQTTPIVSI